MTMQRRTAMILTATLLIALPSLGHAQDVRISSIVIERPWTRATPEGARVGGGFFVLRNTGNEPDRLIGGTFPGAPRFEVHEMATVDGVMRMRELSGGLIIPPRGQVELKPGGYHVMFMDLTQPIRSGGRVKGTLVFERAGTVEVEYAVTAPGAPAPGGHGTMRH